MTGVREFITYQVFSVTPDDGSVINTTSFRGSRMNGTAYRIYQAVEFTNSISIVANSSSTAYQNQVLAFDNSFNLIAVIPFASDRILTNSELVIDAENGAVYIDDETVVYNNDLIRSANYFTVVFDGDPIVETTDETDY